MISVITPVNSMKYVRKAYESLKEQTLQNWEWIVLINGGVKESSFKGQIPEDPRIHCYESSVTGKVGVLKKEACCKAEGDIIVELDQDDYLLPTALEKVSEVFEKNKDVIFVYSNGAHFNDSDKTPYLFGTDYGWEYRDVEFMGTAYKEALQPEPLPQNLSYVWYSPDHVRAWRKADYFDVGGHNEEMRVLDDQDLMCRLFQRGRFFHITELLYLKRVHKDSTWLKYSEEIQQGTVRLHDEYIEPMMKKWCKENNLKMIDLCSGDFLPPDYELLDLRNGIDLNEDWPLPENSVGLIRAFDAIEHLKSPIHTMNEAYRVLVHGGLFMIQVPSTDGRGAFQDPTHVSFWNSNSFWYYTKKNYNQYLGSKCPVRFQTSRIVTYIPNDFCKQNYISYVRADLTAIKQEIPKYFGFMEI